MSYLFLGDAALGVLLMGLGVPLMLRKVGRNSIYGFRTPKTLSDDKIWYEANRYAGMLMLVCGAVIVVAAAAARMIIGEPAPGKKPDETLLFTLSILVPAIPLAFCMIASFRHLRKL